MSADEFLALLVACAVAIIAAVVWYGTIVRVTGLGGGRRLRVALGALGVLPVACLVLVAVVLRKWADPQVPASAGLTVLFLASALVWMAAAGVLTRVLGVSIRDDAVERRNPAAAVVAGGAMVGVTLCFAGGNIGPGPTVWTTLGPAAMAAGTLLLLWLLVELSSGVSDSVTLDRDLASGVRLGAMLIACGLVLGRAVAGRWESADDTARDFVREGWPAAAVALVAAVVHVLLSPTSRTPRPAIVASGLIPAVLYLAVAAAWVAYLGWWQ
jgi:hypothetical protein